MWWSTMADIAQMMAAVIYAFTTIVHLVTGADFCQFQTFNASCHANQVVVMETALYGRMRPGRCVQANFGYVGCSADVLDLADAECSGRRRCSLKVPHESFASRGPCQSDLKSYLSATYSCLEVAAIEDSSRCRQCQSVPVATTSGYIASVSTYETGCGSPSCPWLIRAEPGQRINLTLVDFQYARATHLGGDECRALATVREANGRAALVCARGSRETHAFLSQTNSVTLRIVGKSGEKSDAFLIKYESAGCADPAPPIGGWVQRTEDTALVGCNITSLTRKLRCHLGEWQGASVQCETPKESSLSDITIDFTNLPYGISILIIAGVTIVVAVVIFCIGFALVRRNSNAATKRTRMYADPIASPSHKNVTPGCYMTPHEGAHVDVAQRYAHIWERPLPDPSGDDAHTNGDVTSGYYGSGSVGYHPERVTLQRYGNNPGVRNEYDQAYDGDYSKNVRRSSTQ